MIYAVNYSVTVENYCNIVTILIQNENNYLNKIININLKINLITHLIPIIQEIHSFKIF